MKRPIIAKGWFLTGALALAGAIALVGFFTLTAGTRTVQAAHEDAGGAIGVAGQQIFAAGGHVTVELHRGSAAFTNEFKLFRPHGVVISLGTNKDPVGTKFTICCDLQQGEELIFGIFVRNTGRTYKTGPASRNPDGLLHARVACVVPEPPHAELHVGFEDLFGGGDNDFNDAKLILTGGVKCGNNG